MVAGVERRLYAQVKRQRCYCKTWCLQEKAVLFLLRFGGVFSQCLRSEPETVAYALKIMKVMLFLS